MANLMRANGLDFGHERLEEDGGSGFNMIEPLTGVSKCDVIHQVRSPPDSIASMFAIGDFWKNFEDIVDLKIEEHDSKLIKTMKAWLVWNRYCEKRSSFTYRVEEIPFEKIHKLTGMGFTVFHSVDRGKSRKHSGLYMPVTWELMAEEDPVTHEAIRQVAHRYGYEV